MIVTSATSAFKENVEFNDDDDDDVQQQPPVINNDAYVGANLPSEVAKHPKSKHVDESNRNGMTQSKNISDDGQGNQGQDEWEEFDSSNNSKYEQLRLKFSGRINNDDDDYDDDDVDGRLNANDDQHQGNLDREQTKDKPVWNIHQINQASESNAAPTVEEKVEEPAAKPTTAAAAVVGAYRPPQLRSGGPSVTVVSAGVHQRPNKKKEPNLASTDEFPSLKSTVNKK